MIIIVIMIKRTYKINTTTLNTNVKYVNKFKKK